GIDDGKAGAAAAPRLEGIGFVEPGKGVEFRTEVALGEIAVMKKQVIGELAPAELGQECLGCCGVAARRGGPPDLPRADLAEGEVRGEARGGVDRRQTRLEPIVRQRSVEER